MKKIEWTLDGDLLTIRIDLTQEFGPSSSGETTIRVLPWGPDLVTQLMVGKGRDEHEKIMGTTGRHQTAVRPGSIFRSGCWAYLSDGPVLAPSLDCQHVEGPSDRGRLGGLRLH